MRDELESLERAGIIERSDSPWASPLVPVRKSNNKIRLCVDYRKLNSVTVTEPYYIPSFEEVVSKVGHAKVLSKLDLTKGFHQMEVCAEDRPKTAFVCPFGKWHFRKMPFGLCNAPSAFQRLMDIVLKDCMNCSTVYIDDILVWSKNWEQHLTHLRLVFSSLKAAGLTRRPEKCQFGRTSLEFLGHHLGNGRISVPESRIMALAGYKRPRTKKQLRAFLGTANYYRKFIPNFHQDSAKLTPATSKAALSVVEWTEDTETCICKFKICFVKSHVFVYPCPK